MPRLGGERESPLHPSGAVWFYEGRLYFTPFFLCRLNNGYYILPATGQVPRSAGFSAVSLFCVISLVTIIFLCNLLLDGPQAPHPCMRDSVMARSPWGRCLFFPLFPCAIASGQGGYYTPLSAVQVSPVRF